MFQTPLQLKPCKWTPWYKCLVCKKCFQFKNGLIIHKRRTECGRLYPTLEERNLLHRKITGSNLSAVFDDVEVLETSPITINKNARTIGSDDGNREISCNELPSNFKAVDADILNLNPNLSNSMSKSQTLPIHMNLLHTNEEIRNKCTVCERILNSATALNVHMLIHDHEGRKPFSCSICQKDFRQAGNVKIHMLIHEGSKPFSCRICRKEFRQQTTLNNHILIHEGLKPFLCNVCHKSFRQRENINNHKCDSYSIVIL